MADDSKDEPRTYTINRADTEPNPDDDEFTATVKRLQREELDRLDRARRDWPSIEAAPGLFARALAERGLRWNPETNRSERIPKGPTPWHKSEDFFETSVRVYCEILKSRRESRERTSEKITVAELAGEMQPPLKRAAWYKRAAARFSFTQVRTEAIGRLRAEENLED